MVRRTTAVAAIAHLSVLETRSLASAALLRLTGDEAMHAMRHKETDHGVRQARRERTIASGLTTSPAASGTRWTGGLITRSAIRPAGEPNPPPSNQGDVRYAYHLEKTYDLTLDEYYEMLEAQDHVCAICGGTDEGRRLAVDHCHVTGKVRQLPCSKCNRGLRFFQDDPALLERAIAYLARSTGTVTA